MNLTLKTTMELSTNATDDPQFVELVAHILDQLVLKGRPAGVFVIEIDNWFDHKWLNFSGKGRVAFNGGLPEPDTALDEFFQEKVTFPPFNPQRVVAEWLFAPDPNGEYLPSLDGPLIHRRRFESSANNLHKRVTDFSRSAVFLWFSSNTKSNRRGSVMVYEVNGSVVQTWFVGFAKNGEWEISQTKGIGRGVAVELLSRD